MFDIADFLAIQKLIHLYPKHLDSGDLDGLGMLFAHADVYMTKDGDPVSCNPAAVTAAFAEFVQLYDGIPRTRHMICNVIIEPQSPTLASATSSVFVLQATDKLPLQPIITGDYSDKFVKQDGIWQFSERRITNDLFGNLSAHGKYSFAG